MWVMGLCSAAPCQCFSPGAIRTTSPERISLTGVFHNWTVPQPAVMIRVCPNACVCQTVRGSSMPPRIR